MSEHNHLPALPRTASSQEKIDQYKEVLERIKLLIEGEDNLTAVLASIVCELHHSFDYFHWTGFYQLDFNSKGFLVIGPYQGSHGCLRIPLGRGVCGTAALKQKTQLVADVEAFPGHIACASSTRSEIVLPYFSASGDLLGVLDVDSNFEAAFKETDQQGLEKICALLRSWNAFHQFLGPVST